MTALAAPDTRSDATSPAPGRVNGVRCLDDYHAIVFEADFDGTKWNPRVGVSCTTLPSRTLDEIYEGLTTHDSLHMGEATSFIKNVDLSGFEPLDGFGFLYVIEFTAHVVKVGQTVDPRRRLLQHQRDANTFKTLISNFWISPPHVNYVDNELELIGICAQASFRCRREYFHDIGFRWTAFVASELSFHAEAVKVR